MNDFSQNNQYGITDKTKYFGKNESLICYAVACVAYILISLIVSEAKNGLNIADGSVGYWLCYALISLSIGCVALVFAKFQKKDVLSSTTLNKAPHVSHVAWGIVVVVGLIFFMNPIVSWICDLIESAGLHRPTVSIVLDIVPLLLVATFLPAFCEELLFRAIVSNGLLNTSNNKVVATVFAGALFALFHANPAQTLHQFVFGCFLVIVAYRSGSVWTSIILHFFNNVISVVGEFCFPAWLVTGWIPCVCGLIVSAIGIFCYFRYTKNQNAAKQTEKASFLSIALVSIAIAIFIFLWFATLIAE